MTNKEIQNLIYKACSNNSPTGKTSVYVEMRSNRKILLEGNLTIQQLIAIGRDLDAAKLIRKEVK